MRWKEPTVTSEMHLAIGSLNARFAYRTDKPGDAWIIGRKGKFSGDCEDYAFTLLWELAGSMGALYWLLLTRQAAIWYVTDPRGGSHAVLWYRGWYADTWGYRWQRGIPHRLRRRFSIIKMLWRQAKGQL